MVQDFPLSFQEKVIFGLRSLYTKAGYAQYKMNKFEEYDLYARNKDFLISDSVITFMDTNGKLMALKPDVTLSIVKNSKDDPESIQKVYYNENVYRVAKGSNGFREMMQVGLECIGQIDDYCICEVLGLAAQSLRSISRESVLEISHLGFLSDLIDTIGIPRSQKGNALKYIGEKNSHELCALCRSCNLPEENVTLLRDLLSITGQPEEVIPKLKQMIGNCVNTQPLEQLIQAVSALDDPNLRAMLRFDLSVTDDIHYYNGIVFKGFINGIPTSVLTGGQYDNLMRRMRRRSGAIGFAVYTDLLERMEQIQNECDVDTVVLYDSTVSLAAVRSEVKKRMDCGESVLVQRSIPETVRYRYLVRLQGSEVEILENNA